MKRSVMRMICGALASKYIYLLVLYKQLDISGIVGQRLKIFDPYGSIF